MEPLTLTIVVVVAVLVIGVVVFVLMQKDNRPIKENTKQQRLAQIRSKPLYGFYDEEVAEKVGYSVYELPDSRQVKVTTVTDNANALKERRVGKKTIYVGPVKKCRSSRVNRTDLDIADDLFDDFLDIALWFYFFNDDYDQMYEYDSSGDFSPEIAPSDELPYVDPQQDVAEEPQAEVATEEAVSELGAASALLRKQRSQRQSQSL